MQHSRYAYAAGYCDGKAVLEVACGAGQGLGYLAKRARRVVGGDYTPALLQLARQHYQSSVPLVCLDAHALPFATGSFEVVLLFEAIYYLTEAREFIAECRRVLRRDGVLLVCSANKKWPGFTPSPYAFRYFDAQELRDLLTKTGFDVEIYGVFPAKPSTATDTGIALIRSIGARLNLIPRSLKGRELLKRLFYGRLAIVGPEIDERMAQTAKLFSVEDGRSSSEYRVLYATGRVRNHEALDVDYSSPVKSAVP